VTGTANLHACWRFSSARRDGLGSLTQHMPQDHHDFFSQLLHTIKTEQLEK
jgi:hypothetical protein